jgi:hypothetical protein
MYYVYQIIDPRDGLPFYVGKGSGDRCMDHLRESEDRTTNRHKFYRIQYLLSNGLQPIIEKVIENIQSEDEAYLLESDLIKKYGRIGYEDGGILTNICLDARPPSPKGKVKSETHRQRLSESHKGKVMSDITKARILNTKTQNDTFISGMTGKTHSKETKEKISKAKIGSVVSEETKKKVSQTLSGKPWTEARRAASLTQKKSGPKTTKGKPWSEARRQAYQKAKKEIK